jgi:ABC-type glycerol-3-phosphate transport system permease component
VRLKYRFRDTIGRMILFAYLTPSALLFIPLVVIVAVRYLITGHLFRWGLIMAGSVAAEVPAMVPYYLGQRFVVQGLAAGAVKG